MGYGKIANFTRPNGQDSIFQKWVRPVDTDRRKREMRKQQRIEELRLSNGLPPIMSFRQDSNVPELSRNVQTELHKLFLRRNQNQDFFSLQNETKESKKGAKPGKKVVEDLNDSSGSQDNDCAICMDITRNSVLRPCNHMITCYKCSMLLLNRQDNCPVCREKIEDVIKIFMS